MDEQSMTLGNNKVNSLAEATRDSAIANQVSRLAGLVSELREEVFMLGDKIQPCLTPTSAPPVNGGVGTKQDSPVHSDMAEAVNQMSQQIQATIGFLAQLKNRVEL